MKASTISNLKKELKLRHPEQIVNYCIRLAKYKKENKELLTYLLFEADNEAEYIKSVKDEIDVQFKAMNKSNLYLTKKTVRKALKTTNKFIRYTGQKQTEVELLLYFCKNLIDSGIPLKRSRILSNIFERQVIKIDIAMKTLHEDLQYDYSQELDDLHL